MYAVAEREASRRPTGQRDREGEGGKRGEVRCSLSIQDKIRSSVRGMTHCFRVRRLLVATSLDIIDKMPIIIMRVWRGMIYIYERTGVYA